MIRRWLVMWWYRQIWRAMLRASPPVSRSRCANRFTMAGYFGDVEVIVTARDTRLPDGCSREEVMAMLAEVRRAERRMGWKCPEPDNG